MFVVPFRTDTRPLSRLLDDAFGRVLAATPATAPLRTPALDVAESDKAYTVTLDMPGVTREALKVSVEGRRVSVSTQDTEAPAPTAATADAAPEAPAQIIYRERATPRYARSFTLPAEVEADSAAARLEQGVLTLTLPKRGARSASRITVN